MSVILDQPLTADKPPGQTRRLRLGIVGAADCGHVCDGGTADERLEIVAGALSSDPSVPGRKAGLAS